MYTNSFLRGIRKKAFRRGLWYKVLDRFDRGFYNLVCSVVDRVDSELLGVEIVKILVKLVKALKSGFVRHMEMFGLGRVVKLTRLAVEWGNVVAKVWAHDRGFMGYVSMMDWNQPTGFGV